MLRYVRNDGGKSLLFIGAHHCKLCEAIVPELRSLDFRYDQMANQKPSCSLDEAFTIMLGIYKKTDEKLIAKEMLASYNEFVAPYNGFFKAKDQQDGDFYTGYEYNPNSFLSLFRFYPK